MHLITYILNSFISEQNVLPTALSENSSPTQAKGWPSKRTLKPLEKVLLFFKLIFYFPFMNNPIKLYVQKYCLKRYCLLLLH